MMMKIFKDLTLRFILGGTAVAACYIALQMIPWKSFAGIFAAFPAVMISAVIMAGYFVNSRHASDVALGAAAGMAGCTVCVMTAYYGMTRYSSWWLILALSLLAWLVSSVIFITLIQQLFKAYRKPSGDKN